MSSVALQPSAFAAANPPTGTSGTTGTSAPSNSSQTSLNALGSTFLSLLTQELRNQDPTAPVDSTQMVGQMISLNQLDQIASINQLLTNTLGSTTKTAANIAGGNIASAQQAAALAAQAGLQNAPNAGFTTNASAITQSNL